MRALALAVLAIAIVSVGYGAGYWYRSVALIFLTAFLTGSVLLYFST
jgi:hypothetical protein